MLVPPRPWSIVPAVGFLLSFAWGHPSFGDDAEKQRPVPLRPIVAGFERFGADDVESGLLLAGELNCKACHRIPSGLAPHLRTRPAPVLDGVGSRVQVDYLKAFLADPHAVKPGTTMPDLLADWPEAEKTDAIEALTHFLATTGRVAPFRIHRKSIALGKELYHQVGCVPCHGAQGGGSLVPPTAYPQVPLGNLANKTTVPALAAFLQDPHKSRPSGRMPALLLNRQEANTIAQFLLRDQNVSTEPNVAYRYYEGEWDKLPDFKDLTPVVTGTAEGFDLGVAKQNTNMALQFEGFLPIEHAGTYAFQLTSDDGSKLFVDDQLVVDNDGVHAPIVKRGRLRLEKGVHKVVAEVFNSGVGVELDVEFQGPSFPRQSLERFLVLTEDEARNVIGGADAADRLARDDAKIEKGRALFARIGCASCHQLEQNGKAIASLLEARPFDSVRPGEGCLAEAPGKAVPHFHLSPPQRAALSTALSATAALASRAPTPGETITRTLTTFNCNACHQRDGRGGVEEAFNPFFETTQKEMGDEGRIPPHLNGIGAKLRPEALRRILADGAKVRPYMLTRMPKFGGDDLGQLADTFAVLDHVEPVRAVTFEESPRKVKSLGRFLVGGQALGCIKCHTFNKVEAEGIQAIDMTIMHQRLNRDWFQRYVVDPPKFRPGTRMPSGWPEGKTMLPKVLEGDTVKQVEAIWRFLADGSSAAEPYGLGREPFPLFPGGEAMIYRNFIQGGGTRAIGVGYPEKTNLAFDANALRIALIWQGGFIDAGRHWHGRGEGFQAPMGENVVALPAGPPFARLSSPTQPWPTSTSRELGYRFRGYRLSPDQRPTFLYDLNAVSVEDHPDAVAGKDVASLKRTLHIRTEAPIGDLWFRAAVGDAIRPLGDAWFQINGEWKVRFQGTEAPVVRASGNTTELLVPITFQDHEATVVEQIEW